MCCQVSQAVDDHFAYTLSSNERQEDSDEEGDDELFDHEDKDNGTDNKLDDIERVLIVKGTTVRREHRFLPIFTIFHIVKLWMATTQ